MMYASIPNWSRDNDGWGGPPPKKDGGLIYIARDEGEVFKVDEELAYDADYEKSARSNYPVVLKLFLSDIIKDYLDANRMFDTQLLDPDCVEQAAAIAASLRELAAKLDNADIN